MKAIVCDKCGHVMPQPDFKDFALPEGVNALRHWGPEKNGRRTLETEELCDACAAEVLAIIKQKGAGQHD